MYPILGRTFSGFIFTFTVVLALSIFLGFALTARLNDDKKVADWAETAVFVIISAWIGARAGFIWANWSYYQEEPAQIYALWQGGLSYHGAMLAGLVALVGWSVLKKRPFISYAALFAPALILINAGGWLACYYEGCAYGAETWIAPFSANLPDTLGIFAVRYQTQLAGFILTLLLFSATLFLRKRRNEWHYFGLALSTLALIHLTIGQFRGDVTYASLANALDVSFILLGIICWGYGRLQDTSSS